MECFSVLQMKNFFCKCQSVSLNYFIITLFTLQKEYTCILVYLGNGSLKEKKVEIVGDPTAQRRPPMAFRGLSFQFVFFVDML